MFEYKNKMHETIISAMADRRIDFARPWSLPATPFNPATQEKYRSRNMVHLWARMSELCSDDPRWCGYHQAKDELGTYVRRQESGSVITNEDGFKRYVFHISQLGHSTSYRSAGWREGIDYFNTMLLLLRNGIAMDDLSKRKIIINITWHAALLAEEKTASSLSGMKWISATNRLSALIACAAIFSDLGITVDDDEMTGLISLNRNFETRWMIVLGGRPGRIRSICATADAIYAAMTGRRERVTA